MSEIEKIAALTPGMRALADRFRAGERPALARAISVVENERPGFEGLLHDALSHAEGRSERIGLTGPPGAGKSTLVSEIAARERSEGSEVGIIAVDPTSPFSGGALLGDRIRMNDLATDSGVFIRSMATRGSLGGLATTTKEVVDLMDAFGFPRVLIETVGVGQTELDIQSAADTVVVVLVPESGDGVQAMKAGLMEIADIFVVNKADRPGADRLVQELSLALHLRAGEAMRDIPAHHGVDHSAGREADGDAAPKKARRWEKTAPEDMEAWEVPVLKTVAQTGEGLDELRDAIANHRIFLEASGELERRREARVARRVRDVVDRDLRRRVWDSGERKALLTEALPQGVVGVETPYSIARRVITHFLNPAGRPMSRLSEDSE